MTYKVSEEGNISTVFLNGEIDMDVADKARLTILPLIEAGHEVIAVSRQERSTYQSNPAWNIVQQVQINQRKRETLAIKFVN